MIIVTTDWTIRPGRHLFFLPSRTILILNMYGVEDIIYQVFSEPAHGLVAYECTCFIEWDQVTVTVISTFASTSVWLVNE